jgi:hypothetical protein
MSSAATSCFRSFSFLALLIALLGGCSNSTGKAVTTEQSETSEQPATSTTNFQSGGWQHYANLGGNSSVHAYEIGDDYVRVRFTDGSIYLYTYASAGESNIERMKEVANAGKGLGSFIMHNVKHAYESKER